MMYLRIAVRIVSADGSSVMSAPFTKRSVRSTSCRQYWSISARFVDAKIFRSGVTEYLTTSSSRLRSVGLLDLHSETTGSEGLPNSRRARRARGACAYFTRTASVRSSSSLDSASESCVLPTRRACGISLLLVSNSMRRASRSADSLDIFMSCSL